MTNSINYYINRSVEKEKIKKSDEVFEALCREHGLRITPQRAAVYRALSGSADHPSTSGVYRSVRRSLPNISFDTVYRTLITFNSKGVIKMVEGTSDEARFEPDLESHHHFRCVECREITDFTDSSLDNIEVPVEISSKFTVTSKRVVLEGSCRSCRRG